MQTKEECRVPPTCTRPQPLHPDDVPCRVERVFVGAFHGERLGVSGFLRLLARKVASNGFNKIEERREQELYFFNRMELSVHRILAVIDTEYENIPKNDSKWGLGGFEALGVQGGSGGRFLRQSRVRLARPVLR